MRDHPRGVGRCRRYDGTWAEGIANSVGTLEGGSGFSSMPVVGGEGRCIGTVIKLGGACDGEVAREAVVVLFDGLWSECGFDVPYSKYI